MTKLTAIDLFSGCGGLTVGLKKAGFDVLAAIELDPSANEAYRANHSDVELIEKDIRKVAAAGVMRRLGLRPGQLDLLAGCPPCQGFSVLRTRNGAKQNRDRKNWLLRDMLRFARRLQPKVVMMENVPALQTRKAFAQLRSGLERAGYLVSWEVRDAANFKVPQRRKRLILVAGLGFKIELPERCNSIRTVRHAIGNLATAGRSGDDLHDIPENRSDKIVGLIKRIPKDGGSRNSLPKSEQLDCHRACDGFYDIYGRMAWDKVAPTITSGCFNPSKGRFLHPRANRAITMREAALLQTFPRRYKFPVSRGKETIALMIGNALPPEFIRRHAEAIARALHGRRRALRRMPRERSAAHVRVC